MLRVAVTGATGFIGRAVVEAMATRGDDVTALTRRPDGTAGVHLPSGVRVARFDPNAAHDPQPFEDQDAVVHLAAEPILGRWTAQKKKAIWDSRVNGTRALVASLESCRHGPGVLISASGAGYYGDRGDEPLDEASSAGDDFLAKLCVAWEAQALAAQKFGLRVVLMRQGVVFGEGGALAQMAAPFRWLAGGPLGSGKQWFPWIHIDDLMSLFAFALAKDEVAGPMNAVSPDAATSARIAAAIGRSLHRPAFAAVPAFMLKLVLGEFADTLLVSQKIKPARAMAAGFIFRNAALEPAVSGLLGRKGRP